MSDESQNEKRNESKNENESISWLSIREASFVLKVSERAIQIRAKQGKIPSRKVGGRWEVLATNAPQNETPPKPRNENEISRKNESDSRKRNEPQNENETPISFTETAQVKQLENELAFLRAEREKDSEEIAFLRGEVERRNTAESELRRLMLTDKQELLELRQRVAIGEAPHSETGKDTSEAGTGAQRAKARRWYEFWRR